MKKTILYHRVAINKKVERGFQWDDKFEIVEVEVLAENESRVVLNDDCFTILMKKKSDFMTSVGNESIIIRTNNSICGDGIFYTLYSYSKKRPATIRKEIEAKIQKEYSWLMNEADLSIIK